ncbi:hypothetical protein [Enterobacter asburiae]|uniref:hypothetical protein n=1 Tax=Enterobacter asburiae TaxID=61645 RepID=UPI001E4B4995|nr:hypothetical protein [Enterobacter asburiae]MCE2003860.1 hypothetical protein [Enterobacter asburiae]
MKSVFRTIVAFTLSTGFCAGAFAGQSVSDADVSKKLDQLNIAAQAIDIHLQQILTVLNTGAKSGVCWLDGRAFSQGATAKVSSGKEKDLICSVNDKGWPQWKAPADSESNSELKLNSLNAG